ncbi:hypothetical protein Tco_0710844 [Tanacetum coccineum]
MRSFYKIWFGPRRQESSAPGRKYGETEQNQDEWNNFVTWWVPSDRVARSLQKSANRSRRTKILTHQGKKAFAQTWQERIMKCTGLVAQLSAASVHSIPDVKVGRRWTDIEAKRSRGRVCIRKQTAKAQQRAYLAALKADAAYQNSETMYGAIVRINIDYASIFWEDIIIKLNKRHREKVVPYTRFLSLLMMHKMKECYRDGEVTPYPTQVVSVNNWALKPNQPEEPLFIDHMLAICNAAELVHSTSSKQPSVSSKEATKGGSSKAPTGSKTCHLKKKKESSSAMDSNPSQTSASTPVVVEMHKEDQQATASFIVYSESASGCDASVDSIAEADPGLSAPNDSIPQQQGMNERTKNTLFDHISAGIGPHVLADQTQSVSEGLKTVLTQPITGKRASSIARQVEEEESSRTIKLEDLVKLVLNVQTSFKDLDSPEDDPFIIVDDSDEDEEDEVHTTTNVETEDTSVPKSSSPSMKLEKNKAEAEAALLKAQPSFPNVGQLNELLVKSLQTEFSKILFAHDFSSLLPIELKDLPSKFNELTEEVKGLKKQVHELEIKLPGDLKEIPTKLVASVQAKLKTLDALLGLLLNVTKALNKFAQVLDSASSKAGDQSVPSAGQADTMPAEEEAEKESTNSDSNDDDDETHVTGSMVEPSTIKKLKKFDFITEDGRHVHLIEEEINHQKKLEEDAKVEAAKQEGELRKA